MAMTTPTFSDDELDRYARHLVLRELGGPGQQRLKRANVAIVGVGGLGCPAALYLAAAGVGQLRLIDHDTVSLSNLQRQVAFATSDVGAPKTHVAAREFTALNPHCTIDARLERLTPDNAADLLSGVDLVLDGVDDFETRFATNQTCHRLGLPLISGAVGRWDGQVAAFNSGQNKDAPPDQQSPCYRCLVPQAPPEADTCARVGIVGALTGVIGSMMALEAIKHITGAGETLIGRVWIYDGLAATSRTVRLPPDPDCPVCGSGG